MDLEAAAAGSDVTEMDAEMPAGGEPPTAAEMAATLAIQIRNHGHDLIRWGRGTLRTRCQVYR